MHTARPRMLPTSAVQRAGAGSRSLPMTSTAMPKAIGTQMARESTYPWNIVVVFGGRALEFVGVPEPGEQPEDADDHREGVVVDVARLHAAGDAGEPAHEARGAVHHDPVDHGLVAPGPQARAQAARAAGEEPVVEVVEAVLALEDRGDGPQARLDL